jgi:hypothetical protein
VETPNAPLHQLTRACCHNSSRKDVEPRRSRSLRQPRATTRNQGDASNDITQSRVDRAHAERRSRRRYEDDEYDDDSEDEDDDELSGAVCFSRRVRKTDTPKGFKLPTDKIKYEGVQEPEAWLDDYLQTIKVHGGTKAIAMQSLQLFLSGPARSWLWKLPEGSIDNWDDLRDEFI